MASYSVSTSHVAPRLRYIGTAPVCTLLPGTLLKGSNIAPKGSDIDSGHSWRSFFSTWDWEGWIKPQVDLVRAAGGNVVRLIGDVRGVNDGTFTLNAYLSRWQQLIEYCATQGILVYSAGGGGSQLAGFTQQQILDVVVGLANLIDQYPETVVAFDVIQESSTGWAADNAAVATSAVRSATATPLTYSHIVSTVSALRDRTWKATLREHVDYFDIHAYVDLPAFCLYDMFWSQGEKKPILIGEFGASDEDGVAAQTARYKSVVDVALNRVNNLHPAGALSWAVKDFQDSPGYRWGMWTADNVVRQPLFDQFNRLLTTPAG